MLTFQLPLHRIQLFLGITLCLSGQAGVRAESHAVVIDAGQYVNHSLGDCGLQRAIDALPEEGGVVEIPEGRFTMERYLLLPSHTTLRGQGEGTVLTAGRPESRREIAAAERGSNEIALGGDTQGLRSGTVFYTWLSTKPDQMGLHRMHIVKEIQDSKIVMENPAGLPLSAERGSQVSWGLHTRLAAPVDKDQNSIRVTDPDLFKPGYALVLKGARRAW